MIPEYGIKTCGKEAPGPFDLGPCIHDPGHEGRCRFRPPDPRLGGYIEVSNDPFPDTLNVLEAELQRLVRQQRKANRITFISSIISMAACAYLITEVIRVVLSR